MFDWTPLVAAFLIGFFSSAHCVGMCGGIMGALSMAIPADAKARRWWILLCYNLGRIISYTLIGVLAGAMAGQLAQLGAASWLRWVAGLLLIAMGLYLADWWRGLTYLETAGRYLWAYIQPLGKRLMPVDSIAKASLLGLVWGWLPCGLVYSALAYAMAQGQAINAGLVMLAFGVGTLPSVLATGLVAQQMGKWLRKPQVRWPLAMTIILFGCWTIWGGGHTGHDHNHHGTPASEMHDHSGADHGGMDHSGMDHSGMDHGAMNHEGMNHEESESNNGEMDHSTMNHNNMDHSHMHHDLMGSPSTDSMPKENTSTSSSSSINHQQH